MCLFSVDLQQNMWVNWLVDIQKNSSSLISARSRKVVHLSFWECGC